MVRVRGGILALQILIPSTSVATLLAQLLQGVLSRDCGGSADKFSAWRSKPDATAAQGRAAASSSDDKTNVCLSTTVRRRVVGHLSQTG